MVLSNQENSECYPAPIPQGHLMILVPELLEEFRAKHFVGEDLTSGFSSIEDSAKFLCVYTPFGTLSVNSASQLVIDVEGGSITIAENIDASISKEQALELVRQSTRPEAAEFLKSLACERG